VLAGDVRDRYMQSTAVGEHRVDERTRQIQAAARLSQHPLDKITDLVRREHNRGELAAPLTCHEHAARLIDPQLLDKRIVEVGLQRAKSRDSVERVPGEFFSIIEQLTITRDPLGDDALDGGVDQFAHGLWLELRIDAARSDAISDPVLDL
jgi:hypothetical protein